MTETSTNTSASTPELCACGCGLGADYSFTGEFSWSRGLAGVRISAHHWVNFASLDMAIEFTDRIRARLPQIRPDVVYDGMDHAVCCSQCGTSLGANARCPRCSRQCDSCLSPATHGRYCVYCAYWDAGNVELDTRVATDEKPENRAARLRNEAALAAEKNKPTPTSRECAKAHPSTWPSQGCED